MTECEEWHKAYRVVSDLLPEYIKLLLEANAIILDIINSDSSIDAVPLIEMSLKIREKLRL